MNFISVTYHYVDDELKYERGIYPVSVDRLEKQLAALRKTFVFINQASLVAAITAGEPLPDTSCLITFDDGLKTQYDNAVPILKKLGVPAIFFINTLPLRRRRACLVHKIHYLLIALPPEMFLDEIKKVHQDICGEPLDMSIINQDKARQINIYDTSAAASLKYVLNSYLMPELANQIIDKIFYRYYADEEKFCRELYINQEQIALLNKSDLFSIGLHTESHVNLSYVNKETAGKEIVDNYDYLSKELGIKEIRSITYPYGQISPEDYKEKIEKVAAGLGLVYGFTTKCGVNNNFNEPLLLKRFDTNDIVAGKKPIYILN